MAFQTGTATDIKDLLNDLDVFLTANGWTNDFDNTAGTLGWYAWSKNNVYVVAGFDTVGGADGPQMVLWQNTSNDDSTDPYNSTGDSGNGPSNILGGNFWTNERGAYNLTGPFVAYWFFEQDANPAYIHVVIEVNTGEFQHFGWGEIEKIGDWPGGEYCYGQYTTAGFSADIPYDSAQNYLLSAVNTADLRCATLRAPQFAELSGSEEWLIIGTPGNGPGGSAGTDRAGNNRGGAVGNGGGGALSGCLSWLRQSQLASFVPLIPMPVFYFNNDTLPDKAILMGTHPDVRKINIGNFDPGDILTVSGEQWYIFPWVKKGREQLNTPESWNGGWAYRRENA